ncbi:MAG: hypothetical protein K0R54_1498 [Clostridiaceae bacterium]|jgi:V/A-type H+-transporting ATPase subunit E|nr:hypothetical protein [Clostridiaceae bacterium]
MTTIEDKIKLFSKIVYDKIQKEEQREIDKYIKEKETTINEEKAKIQNEEEKIVREIEKKAELKANEIIAKEKLIKQQALINLKESIIKSIMLEIKDQLVHYTKTQQYFDFLKKEMIKVLDTLQPGEYNLFLTERDINEYKDSLNEVISKHNGFNISIKINPIDLIGGFIIENGNGRVRIDNSLLEKLEENKENVGVKVMETVA